MSFAIYVEVFTGNAIVIFLPSLQMHLKDVLSALVFLPFLPRIRLVNSTLTALNPLIRYSSSSLSLILDYDHQL